MRGRREEGGGGGGDEGKGRNEGVGWMREGKEEGIGARVHVLTHLAPVKLESFCAVAPVPVQLEELTPCIHTVRTYIYTHTDTQICMYIHTMHINMHTVTISPPIFSASARRVAFSASRLSQMEVGQSAV